MWKLFDIMNKNVSPVPYILSLLKYICNQQMIVGRSKNKIVRIVYVNENLDSFNVLFFLNYEWLANWRI